MLKSEMNTTPYDYLLERRFAQAKSLLQSTNLLIKEIAFRCGFTDEHYFSDLFKRKCGTTPREYRTKKQ
jgi:transcriptional regulator GlxA family with amidase domain